MKHFFLTFLFVLSLSTTCAFAHHDHSNEPGCDAAQKVYLSPDQIFLTDHGIEVDVNGSLFTVRSLGSDEGGIYSEDFRVPPGTWQCPRCCHLNSFFHWSCQNPECTYPDPEDET